MTEIVAIVTAGADALETLGILPYVFAGAVVAVIGLLIRAVKKGAR